jgi:putative cardiolipin synthase
MPDDAFAARLFLIDHATTSLDVQYYIYEDDLIGKVFSSHLLKAAQRGVKVRILLDDISTTGKDHALSLLAYHPNIQLKLFNPNRLRRSFRNLALLLDVNTLGRRMHNKMLVADGAAAIIGGRNIGDVYFTAKTDTIFLDYDILAIGSVVPEIYRSFDLYWNSPQSIPSHEVLSDDNTTQRYQHVVKVLDQALDKFAQTKMGKQLYNAPFYQKIHTHRLVLTVADRTDLYYDHPHKIIMPESDTTYHISKQIDRDLEKVKKDVIIISPYFIPSELMLTEIKKMREHGVKVTVITNSLASTDVFPVYGGYGSVIKPLLQMGVTLYELKPHSLKEFAQKRKVTKSFRTSLHTKMILIDDTRLIVGSANLDPRSDKLNTEIVLFITSQSLARKEREELHQFINLRNLYRISWGVDPSDNDRLEGPIWETMENGKIKRYYYPPNAALWKRLGADLISILPVKGYL